MVRWLVCWLCFMLLMIGLSACSQRDPVATIEAYLQARVSADADKLQSLACADWEAQAALEADSFRLMDAQLEGMACRQTGEQDGFTVVTCEGRMVTSYNGETREWPLGAFRLTQENGEWKMCGEAEAE